VIHRHLMTRLPHEMTHASSYLQSAGGLLGARWRQFGEALDRVASHPVVADRVCASANEAFRTYCRWTETAADLAQRAAG
jgi:heme oxygenase